MSLRFCCDSTCIVLCLSTSKGQHAAFIRIHGPLISQCSQRYNIQALTPIVGFICTDESWTCGTRTVWLDSPVILPAVCGDTTNIFVSHCLLMCFQAVLSHAHKVSQTKDPLLFAKSVPTELKRLKIRMINSMAESYYVFVCLKSTTCQSFFPLSLFRPGPGVCEAKADR